MEESNITLTKTDRLILKSYSEFCEGLSQYIGNGYEIVLHSLENLDHSAIKVINGYHTDRTEGAPITNLALSMLKEIRSKGDGEIYFSYFSKNKKGEPLKSATIPVFGENHRIIGLMCMNFYLNTPLSDLLHDFNAPAVDRVSLPEPQTEIYMNDAKDLIDETIADVRHRVLEDSTISASNKNKEIIRLLYDQGIFNFKGSITKCSNILDISRNTVYMHIRNLNKQ